MGTVGAMSSRRFPAMWALVAWTVLVWTTRIANIWQDDDLESAQQLLRTALAVSFTALAATTAWALWRRPAWLAPAVRLFAGWTLGVWAVRSTAIALGDHSAAFVVVHLVLALASALLAVLALREIRPAPVPSRGLPRGPGCVRRG